MRACRKSEHALYFCLLCRADTISYESSRIFEKPFKHLFARVARGCAPCLGYGAVPHFSLFLRRRRRRKREKKYFGDTPIPDRGAVALCTPAFKKAIRTFQVPEQFGMTHILTENPD